MCVCVCVGDVRVAQDVGVSVGGVCVDVMVSCMCRGGSVCM